MALTPKQNRFVAEYLVDLNATQAAIRAGYSPKTAEKIGSENLRKPEVAKAVEEAKARRAERVEVSQDEVLRELLRIARTDIGEAFDVNGNLRPLHDIPVDVRRAISSVEVDELWEGRGEDRDQVGVTRKLKFWDKTKALELLGKHLALFVERHKHDLGPTLEQLILESLKGKP